MIVDNRYSKISDQEAITEICADMDYWTANGAFNFKEAIVIVKDGGSRDLYMRKMKPQPQS